MKKVLLTTTAIVGLSAPAFAVDPTAVSDQPYFHHSHPFEFSGSMSIALTNPSSSDITTITEKATKRDGLFEVLSGEKQETAVGESSVNTQAAHVAASEALSKMASAINAHASYTVGATTRGGASATAHVSAVEDVIDDFLGGSHSEAMDVLVEAWGNGAANGATPSGSDAADLAADVQAFADSRDAAAEGVENSPQLDTTAKLSVKMAAGNGWTASTSGTIDLGAGSVSGSTVSMSNELLTLSVGKTQHAATSAVSTMFGMDVALDTNSSDDQLQATLALGGAQVQVDNEMDGNDLETSNQTVGIKGSYGTMSYGLGWQADGDLGFSIGTSLGGVGLQIARVNAGTTYSMGLAATVDLGGGMTLNASNAQNSDGLQDKSLTYGALAAAGTYSGTNTITETFALKAVHKSISTVGLEYNGGGTKVGIEYREKASTSASGDNLIASGSMMISPTITLTGSYDKDDAVTTIGASGPLGSAGSIAAVMTSTGKSTLTASFKF
jgi:hypothetical protein